MALRRKSMKVWWMTIYLPSGSSYLELKHRKVIAQGWRRLGDLSSVAQYFDDYWRNNRTQFEELLKLLATPPNYPTTEPSLLNLYDLFNMEEGDLVIAVENDQNINTVKGICQIEESGWQSYCYDSPEAFSYAHTVGFPVMWVDWAEMNIAPPVTPTVIPGVQALESSQAIIDAWTVYTNNS
jgi:hypothetical protein